MTARLRASDSRATEGGAQRVDRWILVLAMILGLLRFARLGDWSLWHDEALTYADAYGRASFDNPLGYWIWRAWLETRADPPTEWDLRFPAAVFGWVCVPLCAWSLRPLTGARWAAAAALCLAVAPWHLAWSQTARFYTLAQALGLLGAGCFARGWLDARLGLLCAGLLLVLAAGSAHPSGWMLAPALLASAWAAERLGSGLAGERRHVGKLLLGAMLLGLCATPLAWEMLERWRRLRGEGTPLHFALTSGFYLTPWVLSAALFGALSIARRGAGARGRDARRLFVLGVALAGAAGAAAISLRARVSAQYVFVFQPWVLALALAALWPADDSGEEQPPAHAGKALLRGLALGLLVLPALVSCALYLSVRQGERPAWREAYAFVHERLEPGDLILGMEGPVGEFYLNPGSKSLRLPERLVWLDEWRAALPGLWSRYERRTWLIVNEEQLVDWDNPGEVALLREYLATRCRLLASWPLEVESRDLSVLVYRSEP